MAGTFSLDSKWASLGALCVCLGGIHRVLCLSVEVSFIRDCPSGEGQSLSKEGGKSWSNVSYDCREFPIEGLLLQSQTIF